MEKFAFEAPFGGLWATYDVHLRHIGKLVGDFLLVIIELFSLGAFVLSHLTEGQNLDSNAVRMLRIKEGQFLTIFFTFFTFY